MSTTVLAAGGFRPEVQLCRRWVDGGLRMWGVGFVGTPKGGLRLTVARWPVTSYLAPLEAEQARLYLPDLLCGRCETTRGPCRWSRALVERRAERRGRGDPSCGQPLAVATRPQKLSSGGVATRDPGTRWREPGLVGSALDGGTVGWSNDLEI